jgi:hypothetical protein
MAALLGVRRDSVRARRNIIGDATPIENAGRDGMMPVNTRQASRVVPGGMGVVVEFDRSWFCARRMRNKNERQIGTER